ncbi:MULTISPECIES: hypothetical protein [Sphingobacterium]|uniref:hypothetical protein n=1 Tax=Sphingobacterium TaxID=28453 RepID=UPI00211B825E|nr:hypothetical protein [Sphingobacterium sp. E70]ULT25996.1 hypothetical protein KUH03_03225 [Sphingobacterium sp. E70]
MSRPSTSKVKTITRAEIIDAHKRLQLVIPKFKGLTVNFYQGKNGKTQDLKTSMLYLLSLFTVILKVVAIHPRTNPYRSDI